MKMVEREGRKFKPDLIRSTQLPILIGKILSVQLEVHWTGLVPIWIKTFCCILLRNKNKNTWIRRLVDECVPKVAEHIETERMPLRIRNTTERFRQQFGSHPTWTVDVIYFGEGIPGEANEMPFSGPRPFLELYVHEVHPVETVEEYIRQELVPIHRVVRRHPDDSPMIVRIYESPIEVNGGGRIYGVAVFSDFEGIRSTCPELIPFIDLYVRMTDSYRGGMAFLADDLTPNSRQFLAANAPPDDPNMNELVVWRAPSTASMQSWQRVPFRK
jgi:hypothetical protein